MRRSSSPTCSACSPRPRTCARACRRSSRSARPSSGLSPQPRPPRPGHASLARARTRGYIPAADDRSPTALVCRRSGCAVPQFRRAGAEFPAAGAAIIGDNGSGKTNLLEALHYLEIFRSFRGAADEQLVRFGARRSTSVALSRTARRVALEITAAYEPRTRRKRVTVDGVEAERLGDAIGRLGTVIFSPSDVASSPVRRASDVGSSTSCCRSTCAATSTRCSATGQVLRQRNALLRDGAARGARAVGRGAGRERRARDRGARGVGARHAERFASCTAPSAARGAAQLAYDGDVPLDGGDAATCRDVAIAPRSRRGSSAWRSGSASAA
jgi:hypothetical protein